MIDYLLPVLSILLIICGLGLLLCVYALWRNDQVFKARTELNAFVFANLDDWKDKCCWQDGLPSYKEMASITPFPPPPLRSFITGRYAEAFWQWRELPS